MSRSYLLLAPLLLFLAVDTPSSEGTSGSGDRSDLERNRQILNQWKGDAEHFARLQHDLKDYWALPKAQRRQLRQLDQSFHQLDARTRQHLWKVAERYLAWLENLPENERRRIEETGGPNERLRVIQTIRERQWIERLPRKVRETLDAMPESERSAEVARLREQERQQRLLWKQPLKGATQSSQPAKPNSKPNKTNRDPGRG